MNYRTYVGVGIFLLLAACNRGSSTGSDFFVVSSNLNQGAIWEINRPVELTFNREVDLSTIHSATIQIRPLPQTTVGGVVAGPVRGNYFLKTGTANVVVFQPDCPLAVDNTGGGLEPNNGVAPPTYELVVISNGQTVRSADGRSISEEFRASFTTRGPSDVFIDLVNGPIQISSIENFPPEGRFTLGLNTFLEPNPLIVLHLNQAILGSSFVNDTIAGSVRLTFDDAGNPGTFDNDIPVDLTLENCTQAGANITVVPQGILPPGRRVRLVIDKDVLDLFSTANISDLSSSSVQIQTAGSPHFDAVNMEFDTTLDQDTSVTDVFVPDAEWQGGILRAAAPIPVLDEAPTVDVTISSKKILDTTSDILVATRISNGSPVNLTVADGLIQVRNFTVENGGQLIAEGPNPLHIVASGDVSVELGGIISVDGGDSPTAGSTQFPTTNPAVPGVGGVGTAGGGDGGSASPSTTASSIGGQDGFGAGNIPGLGGGGGSSALGSTLAATIRAGGGGGANWGLQNNEPNTSANSNNYICQDDTTDLDSIFTGIAECNCRAAATDGLGNLNGEPGTTGTAAAIDAKDGLLFPLGGLHVDANSIVTGGIPVFDDADMANDFWGIGVDFTGPARINGELETPQGGGGGGAGGDGIPSAEVTFPPPSSHDFLTDFKGGSGGGGAGVLWIQALGTVTIDGELSADGGIGGGGAVLTQLNRIGGGGGGGAGGHIIIESSSRVIIGSSSNSSVAAPNIHALGGDRGFGYLNNGSNVCYSGGNSRVGQTTTNDLGDGTGLDLLTGLIPMAMSRGGAGGKGVIQIHCPRVTTGINNGKIDNANLVLLFGGSAPTDDSSETSDAIISGLGLTNITITPSASILVSSIGRVSQVRSQWFNTQWAKLNDSNNPLYYFGNTTSNATLDSTSFCSLTGSGFLNPSADCELLSGSSGTLFLSGPQTAIITNATLANLLTANPKLLINDQIQPNTSSSARFTITNAEVSGNTVTLLTDPDDGNMSGAGAWTIFRRYFEIVTPGLGNALPTGASILVQFQGAPETSAGNGVVNESAATTIDSSSLDAFNTISGEQFFRVIVTFNLGSQYQPGDERPYIDFLKPLFTFD